MFGGNFAPAGWALCQGQLLAISENDALFNLIGTTYGGDGQNTFALPDLQSRVPMHQGTNQGQTFVLGEAAGSEAVTLTTAQTPVHTHGMFGTANNGTATTPTNNVPATAAEVTVFPYGADNPPTTLGANALGPVGGNQPHENRQPFLVINFIIALFGIYPTQN